MGQNLILNMNDHGYTVAAFNRTVAKVDEFLAREAKGTNVIGAPLPRGNGPRSSKTPPRHAHGPRPANPWIEFIEHLSRNWNPATSSSTAATRFSKTPIPAPKYVESKGLLYIGTGVSGGEEGARARPEHQCPAVRPRLADVKPSPGHRGEGGRGDALLRLGRRKWRRPLCQNGPQRHRYAICN